MKAWHVTCACAIQLLFPLAYVSCLWDLIGWVAQDLFVPRPIVLWGWPRVANCLQRDPCVGRWFSWHLSREGFLPTHLERCVWLVFRQRDKWTCLLLTRLGFVPWGLDPPTERKDTITCSIWRIISRGFCLNGTWSWPKGCSSGISSCLGVDDGNTHGVGVWLSLGNWLHPVNRRIQNNLWRDTWSIPNDPTGCQCLFSLKLGQDGQGREKGWQVVKDSCRVLLLVSAWSL